MGSYKVFASENYKLLMEEPGKARKVAEFREGEGPVAEEYARVYMQDNPGVAVGIVYSGDECNDVDIKGGEKNGA